MKTHPRWFAILLGVWVGVSVGVAQAQVASDSVVQVQAVWDDARAQPGDRRVLAVVLDIKEGYHINADAARIPASESWLIPTQAELTADEGGGGLAGLTVGSAQYPPAHDLDVAFLTEASSLPVFEGRAIVYVPVAVSDDATPGPRALRVTVTIQACDDQMCLMPTTVTRELPLTVVEAGAVSGEPASPPDPSLFAGYDPNQAPSGPAAPGGDAPQAGTSALAGAGLGAWAAMLGLAFLGGLLLNVMPCVLPVIPIKILGLVQAAPEAGRRIRLGLTMSAGVLAFWVGIGIAIAGLANVQGVAALIAQWWFNIGLGVLIAVLAVGMCGLFSIRLPRFVYAVSPKHDSYLGSFGFGIMTAVLATPCTGPFMGGAAGTVLTTGPAAALALFSAIGLGMALPYLLLSMMPGLVEKMPRTGPASELVKQVLGLLMLSAAAFFVGTGINSLLSDGTKGIYQWYWWLCAGIIAGTGLWLLVRTFMITPSLGRRAVFGAIGLVLAFGSLAFAHDATRPSAIDWRYYTPPRLEKALADGQVVMLDFTADWCINCKVLERTVLETRPVIDATAAADVVAMKVDLTGDNPDGWAKLNELGKVAIPLLAVVAPDGRITMNAEVYTADQVVRAIQAAQAD